MMTYAQATTQIGIMHMSVLGQSLRSVTMAEWNIKVEMNQNCCKHAVCRYYDVIEAEAYNEQARRTVH